jgi:hypothetical protein
MTTEERTVLAELAIEYWKLFKLAERTLADAQSDWPTSVSAQLRYSMSRLHAICARGGLKLISYDRETYEPNLPVTVANAEEAASFDNMVIERTLEPTIIFHGQVVVMGKVLLKKRA